MSKRPTLGKKQAALLLAARSCAASYMSHVPPENDENEMRMKDFVAGYCKAMKDCGFDVTDERTLEGITVVEGTMGEA